MEENEGLGGNQVDEAYRKVPGELKVAAREPRKCPEYSVDYYAFYFRDPDGIPLEIAFY